MRFNSMLDNTTWGVSRPYKYMIQSAWWQIYSDNSASVLMNFLTDIYILLVALFNSCYYILHIYILNEAKYQNHYRRIGNHVQRTTLCKDRDGEDISDRGPDLSLSSGPTYFSRLLVTTCMENIFKLKKQPT